MFRTILVYVDTSAGAIQRVRLAIDVARQFNATLIGIAAGLPQMPIQVSSAALGVVAIGPDYSATDRESLEAEFAKAAEVFKEATEGAGIGTAWRTVIDAPSTAISHAATAADLVIVGTGDQSLLGGFEAPSAGDILVHIGRPVLIAPPGQDRMRTRNAVIAWKNTPEAQRAVADAIPFLTEANVVVVQVQEGEDAGPSLTEVLAFLARHGVAARSQVLRGQESADEQIIAFAKRTQADLLIAGAYGRTRLSEWVFGGVTRELLRRAPLPCLFAH